MAKTSPRFAFFGVKRILTCAIAVPVCMAAIIVSTDAAPPPPRGQVTPSMCIQRASAIVDETRSLSIPHLRTRRTVETIGWAAPPSSRDNYCPVWLIILPVVHFYIVTSLELKRYFRPSIVIPVGLRVIVLDDVQPVGVVLDQSGSVDKVFSWNHLCPPSAFAWPSRNVVASADTFWISSPPDGDIVRVAVPGRATSTISVRREDNLPHLEKSTSTRYRFTTSGSVSRESGKWQYASNLEGTRWRSCVTFWAENQQDTPHGWDLGAGSITGACTVGSKIFVTVRRANKRPWEFRPKAEFISVDLASGQQTVMRSDALDITSICWGKLPQIGRQALEKKHLPHAVSQSLAIEEIGTEDVGFMVSGLEIDPRIDILFSHRSRPGVRCVRTDLLTGEHGYEVGLLNLGISLAEDLEFGLIPPIDEAVDGVLRV